MRFAVLRLIEQKLGREWAPEVVFNFSKRPYQRSTVIQKSNCSRITLWPPNLVKRSPDRSAMHSWDQRSCRGQQRSTRGQIAKECLMATNLVGKPFPKVY